MFKERKIVVRNSLKAIAMDIYDNSVMLGNLVSEENRDHKDVIIDDQIALMNSFNAKLKELGYMEGK
jgi:hypothetical protein